MSTYSINSLYLTFGQWRVIDLLRWERYSFYAVFVLLMVPLVLRLPFHIYTFDPFLLSLYGLWLIRLLYYSKKSQAVVNKYRFNLSVTEVLFILLIYLLVISSVTAINVLTSIIYLSLIIRGVLLYIYLRYNFGTLIKIEHIWQLVLFSLATQSIIGILQFLTNSRIGSLNEYFGEAEVYANAVFYTSYGPIIRVVGTFHNPNVLANWFILLSPFLYVTLYFDNKRRNFLLYLLLILNLLTIFFTFSRSGWFCYFIGAILLGTRLSTIKLKQTIRLIIRVISAMVVILPIAALILFSLALLTGFNLTATSERLSDISAGSSWRGGYVNLSLQLISQYPLLGVGLGNFSEAVLLNNNTITFPVNLIDSNELSTVHNLYLQLLTEGGIWAGLSWVVITMMLVVRVWHLSKQVYTDSLYFKIIASWLVAALAGFLLNTNFEALFFHQSIFMVFCFLLGILFALGNSLQQRQAGVG